MTPLHLYNTASRTIERVLPLDGKKIRLYTCGPTVYNFAHIGNFRTFVFEDVLRRALRYAGYEVEQVMNLTDVDDKTIRGALAEKISLNEFTARYKKAFFDDIQTLGIEKIEHYPSATDYIPQMIAMCQRLLDKNVAYKGSDGSLYFAISKFKEYGKLSHLNLDDLKKGASERVNQDEYTKEQPADFVLWKAHDKARDGDIFWESPFGPGRPGWHLECSVMANAILGETIDIHAGGVDLIFPHHENEIAQSECCTGKCFSRLWVHAEHLLVDGQKMSKSLGNFYTLRDLTQKGYSGQAIRFLLLQSHYRMPLNFTLHGLESAKASLGRINDFIVRLENYQNETKDINIDAFLKETKELFLKALAHDLNIPEATAVLYELIRKVHGFCDHKQITTDDAKRIKDLVKGFDSVLGICSFTHEEVPPEILALVDERQNARKNKDFKRADAIRDTLLEKGYLLEDSPTGARVKRK